jgi:hypothetical protein
MVWNKDPGVIGTTHVAIMEMGGIALNTARRGQVRVGKTGWLWTSSSAAYSLNQVMENRMCAAGMFSASFVDASTTAAATYGRFVFTYNVSFRYPQNSSVIGSQSTTSAQAQSLFNPNYNYLSTPSPALGEMKEREEEKLRELTSSALDNSFTLVLKKKPGK